MLAIKKGYMKYPCLAYRFIVYYSSLSAYSFFYLLFSYFLQKTFPRRTTATNPWKEAKKCTNQRQPGRSPRAPDRGEKIDL